jgi:hypothetical protein
VEGKNGAVVRKRERPVWGGNVEPGSFGSPFVSSAQMFG